MGSWWDLLWDINWDLIKKEIFFSWDSNAKDVLIISIDSQRFSKYFLKYISYEISIGSNSRSYWEADLGRPKKYNNTKKSQNKEKLKKLGL